MIETKSTRNLRLEGFNPVTQLSKTQEISVLSPSTECYVTFRLPLFLCFLSSFNVLWWLQLWKMCLCITTNKQKINLRFMFDRIKKALGERGIFMP